MLWFLKMRSVTRRKLDLVGTILYTKKYKIIINTWQIKKEYILQGYI